MSILHVRCVVCHGKRKQDGALDVRTRASLLRGGESGPSIIPGKPDESLLIQRIDAGEMPPLGLQRPYAVRPVTSAELEKLRQWIAAGAPEGREEVLKVDGGPDPLVSEEDRKFWSLQPPKRPKVPGGERERVGAHADRCLPIGEAGGEKAEFFPGGGSLGAAEAGVYGSDRFAAGPGRGGSVSAG